MTRRSYSLGGWVDERVPEAAIERELKASGIDDPQFCSWLAPRVGRYRSWTQISQEMPTRTEEMEALTDFQNVIKRAAEYLSHGGLPPTTGALMEEQCWRFDESAFYQEAEAIASALYRFNAMAAQAARRISASRQRPGRRSDHRRDKLYAEVYQRLREHKLPAADALATAADILLRCRITVPADPSARRRAQRNGAKLARQITAIPPL